MRPCLVRSCSKDTERRSYIGRNSSFPTFDCAFDGWLFGSCHIAPAFTYDIRNRQGRSLVIFNLGGHLCSPNPLCVLYHHSSHRGGLHFPLRLEGCYFARASIMKVWTRPRKALLWPSPVSECWFHWTTRFRLVSIGMMWCCLTN